MKKKVKKGKERGRVGGGDKTTMTADLRCLTNLSGLFPVIHV